MKTIAISRDVSGGTQTLRSREVIWKFHESDSNVVNLYDSDIENSVVLVEQSGLRPYQLEPQRVQQNNKQEASPEPYDNNPLDRLGNTDWYWIFLQLIKADDHQLKLMHSQISKQIEADEVLLLSLFLTFLGSVRYMKRCACQVCQPMLTAQESVCCAEIGQVWQKVEDQRPEARQTNEMYYWSSRIWFDMIWIFSMIVF